MALKEAVYLWRTRGIGPGNVRNGGALELSALGGAKNCFGRGKGIGGKTVISARRRISGSPAATISVQQRFDTLSLKSSTRKSQILLTRRGDWNVCRAKNPDENGMHENNNVYDSKGFDENGRGKFSRDQFGVDKDGLDELGIPEDAILGFPITQPEYISYIDPNTGEPSPTHGYRHPLPNAAFWGEDLSRIQKNPPSSAGVKRSSRLSVDDELPRRNESKASDTDQPSPETLSPRKRTGAGRKRRMKEKSVEPSESDKGLLSPKELANIAQLEALKDKFKAEEGGIYKSIAEVIKDSNGDKKAEEGEGGVSENGGKEEEEKEDVSLGNLYGSFGNRGYALVPDSNKEEKAVGKPLTQDELWWNWQKPPAGKEPWSAWQKRAGDSDTVMAAAMAETGQIKLYGEKPTIAEATLARARKRVFYDERMAAEEARKKEIGPLAYYKEWVKAYKGGTSKEAVQKHFEETGEDEGSQFLDMFAYQTAEEYRIMIGTDVRVRRDPLVMRMREDQIKQVWGGDPVYPTVNYEVDPNSVADYRNENMHEPVPDIVEMLRETGRLITQEELKALLAREKIEQQELEEEEFKAVDKFAGAGDDYNEDDFQEDGEEITYKDNKGVQSGQRNTITRSKESAPTEATLELDEVLDVDEVIALHEGDEVTDVDEET